jgi:hypothetical protein
MPCNRAISALTSANLRAGSFSMRFKALVLVLLAASGLAAQEAKPTRAAWRTNLKQWTARFKAANQDVACVGDGSSPSCPFARPIRGLDILQLIHMPDKIEACSAVDRKHRYDYQWTLSQTENLMMRRIAFYRISKDEMDDYAEWEDVQRGIASTPTPMDNGPDTVAKEQ